jgi:hypothetical protein
MLYIYEIGAITYHYKNNEPEKALQWREDLDHFAKTYNIKTFNPTNGYTQNVDKSYNSQLCVDQNEFFLKQCNLAVANLSHIHESPGSIYELVRCKTLGIPVIGFGNFKWENTPHLQSCLSYKADNLNEAKKAIYDMFVMGD